MAASDLLNPRWHDLRGSLQRIYRMLDADERVVGVTLMTASADGEMIVTQVYDGHLERWLALDPSAIIAAGEQAIAAAVSLGAESVGGQ